MPNKIKGSWDKIKPSNATHERILKVVLRHAHDSPHERSNNMKTGMIWKICAPIAACLIVALIVAVPFLMQNTSPTTEPHITYEQEPPMEDIIMGTPVQPEVSTEPTTPATPMPPTYELVLNDETGRASLSPGRMPPGMSFVHFLSEDEADAIQPGLGGRFEMYATYRYDGEFLRIFATETYSHLGMATVGGVDQPASFTISQATDYPLDILHDIEPIVSYIYGIPVIAGVFWLSHHYCDEGMRLYNFNAILEFGDYYYRVELIDSHEGDRGLTRLNEIVHTIIRSTPADLSNLPDPVIPELMNEPMTEDEAFAGSDFGAFLPTNTLSMQSFGDARRVIDQMNNFLNINWHELYRSSISWTVQESQQFFYERLVSVNDREKFDVNLYTIPWMGSVPNEIINYLQSPVFLAEEMSLEVVQARTLYGGGRRGDWGDSQMNLCIMFDGVVVSIGSMGLSAEKVWEMILSIPNF